MVYLSYHPQSYQAVHNGVQTKDLFLSRNHLSTAEQIALASHSCSWNYKLYEKFILNSTVAYSLKSKSEKISRVL